MTHSEQINELATALNKAQAAMHTAKKDSENPHFRSKYADLASVWEACRKPLTDNGLSILQSPRLEFTGDGDAIVELDTLLMHTSGQFIMDTIRMMLSKADAHGVGSAITYCRRYALSAFVSVAPDDDDGNGAVANNAGAQARKWVGKPDTKAAPATKPAGYDEWHDALTAAADNGVEPLREVFESGTPDQRKHLGQAKIDALKQKASQAQETVDRAVE